MPPSANAPSPFNAWAAADQRAGALDYPEASIAAEITRPIEVGQIEDVIPIARGRRNPPAIPSSRTAALLRADLGDDVSDSFFDDGWRQEAAGCFDESPPPPRVSLDRLPWDHRAPLVLLTLILATAAVVAWWTSWIPPGL